MGRGAVFLSQELYLVLFGRALFRRRLAAAAGVRLARDAMPLPLVAILCPREFTFSDPSAAIERAVLDGHAEVRTITLDFDAPLPEEALNADVLLLWHNIPITADVIARLTRCRALIRNGTGYDSVDTAAAAARGIPVCNVPDYGTEEVADHAMMLLLAAHRRCIEQDRMVREGRWGAGFACRTALLAAPGAGSAGEAGAGVFVVNATVRSITT